MNGSLFSITRYMNRVCFKVSGGTSVPKLSPSYPPPPEVQTDHYWKQFGPNCSLDILADKLHSNDLNIMNAHGCNIQRFLKFEKKMKIFSGIFLIFFLFLLKT